MKLLKLLTFTCIVIFLVNCSGKNSSEKSILKFLAELPKELRPSFIEDSTFHEFLNSKRNKTYSLEENKEKSWSHFSHNEANVHLTVNKLYSENDCYFAYCSSVFESFEVNVLRLNDKNWKLVTNECFPKEIQEVLKKDLRIFPELKTDTLYFTDMDDDQKKVTLVWEENKYKLQEPIPEKFGQSAVEQEN